MLSKARKADTFLRRVKWGYKCPLSLANLYQVRRDRLELTLG